MADKHNKSELREKLLANIEKIKKVFPSFNMTEDQINNMISDERIELQNKAKNTITNNDIKEKTNAERMKYAPDDIHDACFSRLIHHITKMDGTPEAEEYNKRMFENLGRDDEMGEISRENLFLACINKTLELDVSKLTADVSEKEFIEYALQHVDDGGITMELQHMRADSFDNYTVKKGSFDKIQMLDDLGTNLGGGLRSVPDYVRSDDFLTFPADYLTLEQIDTLIGNSEFLKNLETLSYCKNRANMQNAAMRAKGLTLEPASSSDFYYGVEQNKRIMGGYNARKANIISGIDELGKLSNDTTGIKELKDALGEYKTAIEALGDNPDDKKIDDFSLIHTKTVKAMNKFNKEHSNLQLSEEGQSALDICRNIKAASLGFKDKKIIKALAEYQRRDSLAKTADSYKEMENSLKKLNDFLLPYQTPDKYGVLPELSADDIIDIKNKMAEVLKNANEFIAESTDDGRQFYAEKIGERMQQQIINLGNALPGMNIDSALSGKMMNVDLTGRSLDKVGNCLSSRQSMSITGPDGRTIKGFFTEKTTLDQKTAQEQIIQKLRIAYPQHKELAGELAAFYADFENDPGFKQKQAKGDEIVSRYPAEQQAEISRMIEDAKNLGDRFTAAKSSYMAMLGDSSNTDIENRNIAMSEVAALLGEENLVAKSIPIKVTNDGIEMTGCFMENAAGDDISHIGKDSHFLDIKPGYLDNSPALKQISDMQVLDYICGNIDRHPGNLFYKFDENNKIIGVTGIDNDMSFFYNPNIKTAAKFADIKDMKYISRSMADKVSQMNPDALKFTLAQRKLCPEAVQASVDRLNELKAAINENKISVMDDNEFLNHKMEDFIPNENSHSYFNQIDSQIKSSVMTMTEESKSAIRNKVKEPKPYNEPLKSFVGVRADLVQSDINAVNELISGVSGAQKRIFNGSRQFSEMEKKLNSLNEFVKKSDGKHVFSTTEIQLYKQGIEGLKKSAQDYLDLKKKQGKLEVKRTTKTGKRIQAANRVLNFCNEKIDKLEKTLEPANEILEMKNESERIQLEAFKANPKLAGEYMKNLNAVANEVKGNLACVSAIGNQLHNVTKFLWQEGISAKDLGINSDDLASAKDNIKKGMEANVTLKEMEKAQAQKNSQKAM